MTELDGSRLQNSVTHDDPIDYNTSPVLFSPNLPRQNLAGGTGVFANFFEEMAEPHAPELFVHNSSFAPSGDGTQDGGPEHYDYDSHNLGTTSLEDYANPMQAFYGRHADDDDLRILSQYKQFVTRSDNNSSLLHPYCYEASPHDQSKWGGNAVASCLQPAAIPEFTMHDELHSDMCISYAQRCKPPKVLAGRFLLGDTIGRGSYGKVKDAIDLVTLRRHAVKIVSKLGVRKIPGGWTQALLEAGVMRRLPPNRHVVSLVSVLRLENPDRLCLVMEHCLGSVHDLQAAGVPSASDDFDDAEDEDQIAFGPECNSEFRFGCAEPHPASSANDPESQMGNNPEPCNSFHRKATGDRRKTSKLNRFRVQFPSIATDMKQEAKKLTDAFKCRKVSNIEAGQRIKRLSNSQGQQQQFRRLPEAQAHAYFLQIIDGLHFLHRNGVIHRDIKPANLLLTPAPGCGLSKLYSEADFMDTVDSDWLDANGGQPGFLGRSLCDLLIASRGWLVKLTDFGVSASLSAFSATDQVSGGQTTPAVQPPEVAKGVQSVFVGSKLDVYSAGVSLYFMLTGRVPFSCQNVLQIFEAIARGEYSIPGHISTNAANLVRKMMCKDPKKRLTLEQISKHPWVEHDPPRPFSMDEARAKFKTRLAQRTDAVITRGIVCWLEPFEFLRRPSNEYPPPHIDDTGALIFSAVELGLDHEMAVPVPPSNDTDSVWSNDQLSQKPGIAPFSVAERLQIYHALSEHPEGMKTFMEPTLQDLYSTQPSAYSFLGIESQLAHLDIDPASPFIPANPICKSLCHSGGTDYFHSMGDHNEPEFTSTCRQRGMTISLPTTASAHRPGHARHKLTNPAECEPPACPEDIPVSPLAMPFPGTKAAMTVEHGGTMRASSYSDYRELGLIEPVVASSQSHQATDSQRTWHSGFRIGGRPMEMIKPPVEHWTPDTLIVTGNPDNEHALVKSNDTVNEDLSVCELNSHHNLRRRLTHWFSSSVSSLKRRLRTRPPRPENAALARHHTAEPFITQSIEPVTSMHDSITSEPVLLEKSGHKYRHWLSIGKVRRSERKDKPSLPGGCDPVTLCSSSCHKAISR